MLGQVLEIETPGRRLSLDRGFLEVHDQTRLLGSIPIADVEAVLLSTPAYQVSGQALSALLENGTPVVFCGTDFKSSGYILPTQGHHAQGARMQFQADAASRSRSNSGDRLLSQRSWHRQTHWTRSALLRDLFVLWRHAFDPVTPKIWKPTPHKDTSRCFSAESFEGARARKASTLS